MNVNRYLTVLAAFALAGCASLERNVASRAFIPLDAAVVSPPSHERLILPSEFGQLGAPVFPDGVLKPAGSASTICLSFTVDEGGEVVDVTPEYFEAEDCTSIESPENHAFFVASRNAVKSWQYLAAATCRFETPEAAASSDDDCTGALEIRPIAVRLAWIFRFTVDRSGSKRVNGMSAPTQASRSE